MSDSRYAVLLFWSERDDAYIATVPELPGCAADGATRQEALAAVERRALRRAAVDTGALEGLYTTDRGFTRTVALSALTVEAAVRPAKGQDVALMVADQMEAYEYVLDAVTGRRPPTQQTVRELHAITTRHQPTYEVQTPLGPQRRSLVGGAYKTEPNDPPRPDGSTFAYAPPLDVPSEMARLLDGLRRGQEEGVHPVLLAAHLHYGFVCVHPFPDGNGRVARQLASIPLLGAARVPFLVFADQRDDYLDALEAADAGRLDAYSRFTLDRSLDALELAIVELESLSEPASALDVLRDTLVVQGGLTRVQLDVAAQRALSEMHTRFERAAGAVDAPPGVRVQSSLVGASERPAAPDGHRTVPSADVLRIEALSEPPAQGHVLLHVWPAVALPERPGPAVLLHPSDDDVKDVPVPLRQIHPTVSAVITAKLDVWSEQVLNQLFRRLSVETGASLRRNGYHS